MDSTHFYQVSVFKVNLRIVAKKISKAMELSKVKSEVKSGEKTRGIT
jgi:hypothetical protein